MTVLRATDGLEEGDAMALTTRGEFRYGDGQADIREELSSYSQEGYPAQHFADARCSCGNGVFRLRLDDDEGAAIRLCTACSVEHPIGDSAGFLADAELEDCACPCGAEAFQITVGVALYAASEAEGARAVWPGRLG